MLHVTSKTNINNGYTCPTNYNNLGTFICRLVAVCLLFVIGKYLYSNLYIFISVFNCVCLNGCHPSEMQGCWHEGTLVKLLTFCLPGRKFDQFFRVFHSFPFTK